jgi:hypothetical protein
VGASVVSGGDAPPILDPAAHALDTISLPVEDFVVVVRVASLLAWRNAGMASAKTNHSWQNPPAMSESKQRQIGKAIN